MISRSDIDKAASQYGKDWDSEYIMTKAFKDGVAWAENMLEMTRTQALDEAMRIIETVGTTGIEHKHKQAQQWLEKYYPNRV